jgi:hypothetical protein
MNPEDSEIWKDTPVYGENYEVSNRGRVRTKKTGLIRKPNITQSGYMQVILAKRHEKQRAVRVHRMVMEVFYGRSDLQVNHIDGNKFNNCLNNLEYCTAKENIAHAKNLGLVNNSGEKNNLSKLTEQQVLEIRRNIKNKTKSQRAMAKDYGVHYQTINDISTRRTWDHLKEEVTIESDIL